MSAVLQALATPRRREILRVVWSRELAHADIHRAFPDVTKGAISHHLKVLSEAGLVESRWEGNHRYFRARKDELGSLCAWLEEMWSSALGRLAVAAELEAARRGPRPGRKRKARPARRASRRKDGKR
jgi:DNA-binding transcriptional ArsR family regulator